MDDNSRDGLLFSKINFPDLIMSCSQPASKSKASRSNHNDSNDTTKTGSTSLSSSSTSSLSSNNQKLAYNKIVENATNNAKRANYSSNNGNANNSNNFNNNNNNKNRNRKNSSNNPNNMNQINSNNQRPNSNNSNKSNYNGFSKNYGSSSSTSSMPASLYYSNLPEQDLKKRNNSTSNNNNNYFKSNLDETKTNNNNNKNETNKENNNNNNNKKNKENNRNNNDANSHHNHHHHNNHHHHQYHYQTFQPYHYNNNGNKNNTNNNNNNNNSNNKHKFLIEKYNHKFNLISFILLRKNDEFISDYKYYLNDQTFYQQVDFFVETQQFDKLRDLFLNNKYVDDLSPIKTLLNNTDSSQQQQQQQAQSTSRLTNFTNSYNCNLFVYTIRKCLENESKLMRQHDENNNNNNQMKSIDESPFLKQVMELLFSKSCRPDVFNLYDGDYPKRNIMHYASHYNCTLIPKLVLKCEREAHDEKEDEQQQQKAKKENEETENDGDDEESDEDTKVNKNELVLIQLCMQTDFNGNTPAHLAAMNNSFDLLKLIHPLCIKYSQLIYNDDGLNPFLLACRHASIEFIQYLIESSLSNLNTVDEIETKLSLDLLNSRDKINSKNCLHFACGRGCGNEALNTVKYLTKLTNNKETRLSLNELIGAISPLVGSIFHVAASNLTRLSTLWYLLELYPIGGLYHLNSDCNQFAESILNRLDFREFTCVDCLIDSVMNLREMAPPNCKSLSCYFNDLIAQHIDSSQIVNTTSNESSSIKFRALLNSCVYKLLIEFRANIFNLPRVRNQWQLLEFCKLLAFMSKFGTNTNKRFTINAANFNTVYFQNFEAFCLNFLNKFIICGDLLPLSNEKQQTTTTTTSKSNELYYILTEIMQSLFELTSVCILSGPYRYTNEFKTKLYSIFWSYLISMEKYASSLGATSSTESEQLMQNISLIKQKCSNELDEKKTPFSLKNLCRIRINYLVFDSNHSLQQQQSTNNDRDIYSALSSNYLLFKLPKEYYELVNFLSFNLIDDLRN